MSDARSSAPSISAARKAPQLRGNARETTTGSGSALSAHSTSPDTRPRSGMSRVARQTIRISSTSVYYRCTSAIIRDRHHLSRSEGMKRRHRAVSLEGLWL